MENHIFIYNEIGTWGNTSDEIRGEINKMPEADSIIVHLSSPGGEVFTGWTIGNMLKNTKQKVTVIIEGLCASIATYIALQADEIQMAETARFMIHNPQVGIDGEEKDLKAAASQLASIKADLVKVYRAKTGLEEGQISEMMDNETWLTAEEAKALGFIDSIIRDVKAVAKYNTNNIPKMENVKEDKSKLDKIFEKMNKFLDNVPKMFVDQDPVDVTLELQDGTRIFVDSEDGELEGKTAWMVDEEGNRTDMPATEGTHILADGRSITIDGEGLVVSVQEAENSKHEDDEDEELKNLVKELKNKNAELESELFKKSASEKLLNTEVASMKIATNELITEVNNIKEMTVGGETIIPKGLIKPKPANQNPVKRENDALGKWAKNAFKLK